MLWNAQLGVVTQATLIYLLLSPEMIPITNTYSTADRISNDYGNTATRDSLDITIDNPPVETRSGNADSSKANPPQLVSRAASKDTQIPLWKTSGTQVLREFISQSLGRLTGAATFTGLSNSKMPPAPVAVIGAASAGFCAGQLIQHQIGSASSAQKIGVGLASVTAMVAGGVITGYASMPTVCMIATGSLIAAVASSAARCARASTSETNSNVEGMSDTHTDAEVYSDSARQRCPDENIALGTKILGFTAGSAPFLIGFLVNPSFWLNHDANISIRNFSVLVEALTVELTKATVSTVGVSVNKDAMIFEEKFKAAMMGFLPYVIASVLCNSVAGSLLQAELKSDQFTNLIVPALVGALANCVKGAANTAASRYVSDPDASLLQSSEQTTRPNQGFQWPISKQLAPKVMLRYLMISCRDSLFFGLQKAGVHPDLANACAVAVYASFAQFRDLTFDLMQGEGWSEPMLKDRS
jgi:hypothetical protein